MAKAPYASNRDDGLSTLLLLVFLGVIIYFGTSYVWDRSHETIAMIYGYVRLIELWPFYALGKALNLSDLPGFSAVTEIVDQVCAPSGIFGGCTRPFDEVAWEELTATSSIINSIFLLVIIIKSVQWIWQSQTKHPSIKYHRTHNMNSFMREMRDSYPHLRIFSKLNLIEKELEDPHWGMSLTARQFVYVHRLIASWSNDDEGRPLPMLDRDKADKIFIQQLGNPLAFWSKADGQADRIGTPKLTISETMVMAIILPLVAATDSDMKSDAFQHARDISNDVKDWCWDQFSIDASSRNEVSWMRPDIDLTYPRSVIAKYIRHPEVQKTINQHAYTRTAIHGLLVQARRLGVLSAADMRWLRFYDRPFWYVIQNVGRPSCFAEAAGVASHYRYEVRAGYPISHPCVTLAVDALQSAIASFAYFSSDIEKYQKLDAPSVAKRD